MRQINALGQRLWTFVPRINPLAGRAEQDHIVCIIRHTRDFHSGGSNRHPGYGQADGCRAIGEQPPDDSGRHVSFDDITIDLGGMTG